MRTLTISLLALFVCALGLPGCVTGRLSPGGEGVDVGFSLPASADRVAQVEQSLQRARGEVDESIAQTRTDTATLVKDAQVNLGDALRAFEQRSQDMAAATQAQRDQLERELESFGLEDLLGDDLLNWVLALLGISLPGALGATALSRKRRGVGVLSGKPKVQHAPAAPKP